MTTYTPGPWTTRLAKKVELGDKEPDIAILGPERELIAEVFGRIKAEIFIDPASNAKLIAASPGLLEALKELTAVLVGMKADPEYFEVELEAIERAEKAIAQAQEGKP